MNEQRIPLPIKGRGAASNPAVRFHSTCSESVDDGWQRPDEALPPLRTTVTRDATRRIITRNDSPDVPFEQSINPYRGCEHGCVYCFARPTHAYWGLSPGLDFETRLFYKPDAAKLLAAELQKPGYRCTPIAIGTNTDPYQPIEKRHRVMREVLEVLSDYQHPVSIVTKSALIERDLDLLADLAARDLVEVTLSVTTLDRELARHLEPRAATPQRRIETIARLTDAGIPTGVLFAPVIPALNDTHMEDVLAACSEAGAHWAGYVLLRLPLEVRELFEEWLRTHRPERAAHVMSLIRDARGGKANDPRFGIRMRGEGVFADMIQRRFVLACKRLGLSRAGRALDVTRFTIPAREASAQMVLF